MEYPDLLATPADWMCQSGPSSDIVVTSRIRLARNLRGSPFPGWASKADNQAALQAVLPAVLALPAMRDAFSAELKSLSRLEKRVLVERHLISREHASRSQGSAAVINSGQTLCVMINEEDHLRMQSMLPGLNLEGALASVMELDDSLDGPLQFAFDSQLGYLTACPSNLGTGLRASAMLHLPGLMLTEDMDKVVQAMNRLGVAVRGLYGEGSEALANLFQVSNQRTLGVSEREAVQRLERLVRDVILAEYRARLRLLQDRRTALCNQVGRAYGALRFSYSIASTEGLNCLSHLRLASDLGFFGEGHSALLDALLLEIQPAHVQWRAGDVLSEERRDEVRAEILRDRLKSLPPPDMSKVDVSRLRALVFQTSSNDE